jgi:hypothetical protein
VPARPTTLDRFTLLIVPPPSIVVGCSRDD